MKLTVVFHYRLAKQFGLDMFHSKLEGMFLSSLSDSVHLVRQSVIDNVTALAESFGAQWTIDHLLPKVLEQYSQVKPEPHFSILSSLEPGLLQPNDNNQGFDADRLGLVS